MNTRDEIEKDMEHIADLVRHQDKMAHQPWDEDEKPEDLARLYYGHLRSAHDGDFRYIPHTVHSDYQGDVVERANCDAILRDLKPWVGKAVWEVYGGHGTRAIVFSMSRTAKKWVLRDKLIEIIEGLENYPVYDEDLLSDLEFDVFYESLRFYVKYDLRRVLNKAGIEISDETSDDELLERAIDIHRNGHFEPRFESPFSAYIPGDDIVKHWND